MVVGGGGPQIDYSVCPRPLLRVFGFSGFQVFGFLGFQVFRFSGFSGFQVFRFFGTLGFSDGTGRDAELDNFFSRQNSCEFGEKLVGN